MQGILQTAKETARVEIDESVEDETRFRGLIRQEVSFIFQKGNVASGIRGGIDAIREDGAPHVQQVCAKLAQRAAQDIQAGNLMEPVKDFLAEEAGRRAAELYQRGLSPLEA